MQAKNNVSKEFPTDPGSPRQCHFLDTCDLFSRRLKFNEKSFAGNTPELKAISPKILRHYDFVKICCTELNHGPDMEQNVT